MANHFTTEDMAELKEFIASFLVRYRKEIKNTIVYNSIFSHARIIEIQVCGVYS